MLFHVTCRGNNRRVIFRDDHDRTRFLEIPQRARALQRPDEQRSNWTAWPENDGL